MNQQKTTPKPLTIAEMKKVKGGFREIPGTIRGSITIRWDEITIRVRDRNAASSGLVAAPGGNRPTGDSGGIMP